MKRIIIRSILLLLPIMLLAGCIEDVPFTKEPGEGYATVEAEVLFTTFMSTELGPASRTGGDQIKEITDLCILVYKRRDQTEIWDLLPDDTANGFTNVRHYSSSDLDLSYTDETPKDFDDDAKAESNTCRAIVTTHLPLGQYYIYAVANTPGLVRSDVPTRDALKDHFVYWQQDNIAANAQMIGAFGRKNASEMNAREENIIEVTYDNMKMHAWLTRTASKVTVDYDATQLNENTWIYLKSVTIHNVPKKCHLWNDNYLHQDDEFYADGETILYSNSTNHLDWPVLSKNESGTATQPNPLRYGSHDEDAPSLFLYENMQGVHDTKPDDYFPKQQDADGDGWVDNPHHVNPGDQLWADQVKLGSYIEVVAYYKSTTKGNEGEGTIKYRFMLGMDAATNYNSCRNQHFKVTMKFLGNANEVDWHIEYTGTPEDGIYVIHPFYISYMYGEAVTVPIVFNGELRPNSKITAEIIRSDWRPDDEDEESYAAWTGRKDPIAAFIPSSSGSTSGSIVQNADTHNVPWHGFLSLCNTNYETDHLGRGISTKSVPAGTNNVNDSRVKYLYMYWLGSKKFSKVEELEGKEVPPQGTRSYNVSVGKHTDVNGDYEIVTTSNGGDIKTHFYMPLYTRALFLVKALGYSGNNPYYDHQRRSVVRIKARLKDGTNVQKDITIMQVRRVVNPKGVYRSKGNNAPFHVQLTHRKYTDTNGHYDYTAFKSEGRWDAYIESSCDASGNPIGNFINLNGEQRVSGNSDEIDFTINFIPDTKPEDQQVNRYAVVMVRYHDYTCRHRIMVRQGYDPDIINEGQTVKWHCFNLRTGDSETESPIDPGSLFRFDNLDQAIDASNNPVGSWRQVPPASYLVLAKDGTQSSVSWNNISYNVDQITISSTGATNDMYLGGVDFNNTFHPIYDYRRTTDPANKQVVSIENSTRMASYYDFRRIRENQDTGYGFGVCYDDNATDTQTGLDTPNDYLYSDPNKRNHGMRCCFIYDKRLGRNMIFPIGATGVGRRKSIENTSTGYAGYLSYANNDTGSTNAYIAPFNDIDKNFGAIYWVMPQYVNRVDIWYPEEEITWCYGWDINYTTYDFNHFSYWPINKKSTSTRYNSDACMIRLVDGPNTPTPR